MLTFHNTRTGQAISAALEVQTLPAEIDWIDGLSPDPSEVGFLERTLGIEVPDLNKMSEIETSSRLYNVGDNLFLTVPIASLNDDGTSQSSPLAFVVTQNVLLTVRFGSIKICDRGPVAVSGLDRPLAGGAGALIVLVEALVDNIADDLEIVTARLDQHSRSIFTEPGAGWRTQGANKNLRHVLVRIGQVRGFTSRISETLLVVTRMARYVAAEAGVRLGAEALGRLDRIAHDAASLSDHETRLSEKIQFLLDATLGLIGVDQNDIFKILTMVSVVGIPPTLIASMYGMNFKNIHEYDWAYGYEYGLLMIFISAVIPLLWFKWRGWW